MSEESKRPEEEQETQGGETPGTEAKAEPGAEDAKDEKKARKKKEKTYTLTREQMEKAELAVK